MDDGFTQLLGRGIDVIELTAGGATDDEMAALADAIDELDREEKVVGLASRMKDAGLLW
jgi:hypothetical protein